MFREDWIMRKVEMTVQFITRLVFHKDFKDASIPLTDLPPQTEALYQQLKALTGNKQFGEAEDLLFENLDTEDERSLEVAVDFYHTLNALSDEELEEGDFSRGEIHDGLQDVLKKFNLDQLGM